MSDPDPMPDDLVVSAVLDGEASPDEAERVASDPRLAARLEQMRSVAGAVGGPVPLVDPTVRDAHLATALAEARRLAPDGPVAAVPVAGPPVVEAGPSSPPPTPPPPPPVDLTAARARRRPAAAQVVLSVAAALLVVVAVGTMLVRLGDVGGSGGSDEAATETDEAPSAADSLGLPEGGADDGSSSEAFTPDAGDAGGGQDQATPTTTADAPTSGAASGIDPELVSLGTFAEGEDLTAAVRGRLVLDPTPEPAGEDPVCQDDFPVPTTLLGRAVVAGEEGLVYVDAVPGSRRRVWFVDPSLPGETGERCRRVVPVDAI